ncbi:MAG: GDP-mannose 4,6-dehydratase [Acidimicrobiia bacterium]
MTSFWSRRLVLVTGGCGFIGSHLVEDLTRLGARVRVLGKYNSRSDIGFLNRADLGDVDVRLGDVADPWFVREAVRDVDTVFHLAALIGIPYSYAAPSQYIDTNVRGTLAVLEAARAEGVRRVVHTSTSETYGTAQYTPIDESHPLVAQSPYSATKIAADKLAESYYLSYGLAVTTLRPFNTYGPRQSMRAVIPTLMTQALHASEIVLGSTDPVRDMNFVTDTVAGFTLVGAADGVEGETYNVGSGKGFTIGEILHLVQRVAETDKPVRVVEERVRPATSEVGALICDYSKAADELGYAPRISLEAGLSSVRDYLAANPPGGDPAGYRV